MVDVSEKFNLQPNVLNATFMIKRIANIYLNWGSEIHIF